MISDPLLAARLAATIAAARAFLDAALRAEGEALAAAGAVVNPSEAGKAQRLGAMRSVEAAHSRSTAAMAALRALTESDERAQDASRSANAPK